MGSSLINVPITIKDRMVGFVMNARIWLFADQIYMPSYWLVLKREGFSGNINFNSVELSYELFQFDHDALSEIYRIHHGQFPNQGIGNQLRPEIEHLILSGRIKVFVLEMDLLTRVGDPYDPLMNESQGFYDSGDPIVASRNQLAEELGKVIGTRWLGKDSADQLHWDRSVIIREMMERYDEGAAVVDTVIDVIVGLWEIGVFAVKLIGNIVEFHFELVGKAVTGDFEGIKDQLIQLGIDTVNSVEDAIAKAKQGYDILQRLNKDPQTQALLYDFFDSLFQSIHYRDTRTIGIRVISAVGIEVLIALATAGAGNVARIAASSTAKTAKLARGTAAARNIGPFTAKSIDLMGDLAKLLKSNTKIPDEHLDLPPVEPMKIPDSGKVGVDSEIDSKTVSEFDVAPNRRILETANSRPIQVKGKVDDIDLELLRQDGQSIIDDPFLSTVRSQLERYDVPVKYDYDFVPHSNFGETTKYLDGGIEIDIFKQNAFMTKDSLATYVHESSHGVAAARGREIGTLADEYQAFRREFLYKKGRRPTLDERKTLFKYVQEDYYDVPKGNVAPLFQDLVK